MFEAIHGSAPRRAGQNLANPSGLLLGAVLMLVHIGQPEVAERVHNAWLRTIEDGIHTYDIFTRRREQAESRHQGVCRGGGRAAGPEAAHAEGRELRAAPRTQAVAQLQATRAIEDRTGMASTSTWTGRRCTRTSWLAKAVQNANGDGLELTMMSNRGVKVWPDGMPETFCTDSYRCRFIGEGSGDRRSR